jgi:hypothetical protein
MLTYRVTLSMILPPSAAIANTRQLSMSWDVASHHEELAGVKSSEPALTCDLDGPRECHLVLATDCWPMGLIGFQRGVMVASRSQLGLPA